jgi:hypothetical protein
MEEARIRIAEGALSFFKPHSMLRPIASIFPLVPLEAEHIYILSRYNVDCKWGWLWQANAPPSYPNDLAKSGIVV